MNVLVIGASGFVGGHLVPALLDAGHEVTGLVRTPKHYDAPDGVRVVAGDLNDPESLDGAFDGVDAVYYLVHSMGEEGDFMERDRRAARNFVDATRGAGVSRVVSLSGLGGERATLSEHLQSRREVEKVLAEGDYDLTVLRAAIIVGAGSASFRMVRQLADRLPLMITPKWVDTDCQPIAIDDVVGYLVGVLNVPETAGEIYEIGGPDVLSYGEMLRRTGRILGKRFVMIPVPVLSPNLSAYWADLVTDVPKGVAHPLILGLKSRTVVADDRIRDLVPLEPAGFDEAVERALAEER